MSVEWKWRQFEASNPPDGVRLLVKMADAQSGISYAIAMLDHRTGKLEMLAQENPKATLPVCWMVIL